jgi:hypothetical protein
MATKAEICNLALSHCGIGEEITNVETEKSQEAVTCRRFYNTALKRTLRAFNWPFAKTTKVLAVIETDPTSEWGFSYEYPTDCVKARRILTGDRTSTDNIPYSVNDGGTQTVIYTDEEDAQLEYTGFLEESGRYPEDFVMAFSFQLAYLIAPRLTAGDPFKLQTRIYNSFVNELNAAQANALNEEQKDADPDSEQILARA